LSLKLSLVELDAIKRAKVLPAYDFIERWVGAGTAYEIEGGGYCVVAPRECLLSNWVVELSVPKIESRRDLKELMGKLAKVSCGYMWLDSGDTEAFEFIWRLNLNTKPLSPLFAWDKKSNTGLNLKGLSISPFSKKEQEKTVEMLTSFPANKGGLTEEEAQTKIAQGLVTSLWHRKKLAGSAILQPQKGGYAALTLVLDPASRGKGLTSRYGTLIGRKLAGEGKTMLASMPNSNMASYRSCVTAGMKIVKRAFFVRLANA
jgi:hypothetical protein